MPIIDIEWVGGGSRDGLCAELAHQLAQAMGSPPGHTWVRLYPLPGINYGEDGPLPPDGPAFAKVMRGNLPSEEEMATEAKTITQVVAHVLGLESQYVHVYYEPPLRGRISFGGEFYGT